MPETAPGRPALVLLHGIGGNAAGFAPLVAQCQALGWEATAWSQPGYDGTAPIEPYDLGGCARALRAWLAKCRPGRVVLVGHSMGGMLAQTLSAQVGGADGPDSGGADGQDSRGADGQVLGGADEQETRGADGQGFEIAGLVLAHTSPAFGKPDGDFQKRFIASRTRPLDEGRSMRDIAGRLVPEMMSPTASAEALAAGIAMMAAVPPATYRLAVRAIATFDGRSHLAGIRVPVLCLAAEHDQTSTPAVLERMAQRIPGADFQCLEGLGHLAPIEDPQRWAASVAVWCGRRLGGDTLEFS